MARGAACQRQRRSDIDKQQDRVLKEKKMKMKMKMKKKKKKKKKHIKYISMLTFYMWFAIQ
jgi:hypothetical protein